MSVSRLNIFIISLKKMERGQLYYNSVVDEAVAREAEAEAQALTHEAEAEALTHEAEAEALTHEAEAEA
jgi:uncharacterized membrane protein YqiK